jgi:protein TonB
MEGFMLAYAPRAERRRLNPPALALIIGAHAAALVAVMSARMNLPETQRDPPFIIKSIEVPPEPTPPKPIDDPRPAPKNTLTTPTPVVDLPIQPGPVVEPLPQPQPGPAVGMGSGPVPIPAPPPVVRTGPRFATAPGAVRPPYPDAMRAAEKEARLRLRLSIDERGRVTAVEPVGKAEPAFLAAARRHILRAWRYTPAMEGDRAIASTTVVTLEFKLDS